MGPLGAHECREPRVARVLAECGGIVRRRFIEAEDVQQALLFAAEATEAVTLPRREPA